jgi:hypothetical protein
MQKLKRGRPATGTTSTTMRVPKALKPAVVALIDSYRAAQEKAWEAQPLKPLSQDAQP